MFDAVPFYSMNQKERLRFSEQHMLVHVFPWLKTEEQRVLPTIKAVCAALRYHAQNAQTRFCSPARRPHAGVIRVITVPDSQ